MKFKNYLFFLLIFINFSLTAMDSPRTTFGDLCIYAQDGKLESIKSILENRKIDINRQDNLGRTMLHYAANNGHDDIVEYLISEGAKVNVKSVCGNTPLHLAANEKHKSTAKILLQSKANFAITNQDGLSPRVNRPSRFREVGLTPAETSQVKTNSPVISIEIKEFEKSLDRATRVRFYAQAGNIDLLKKLQKNKINKIDECDEHGKAAIHYAFETRNVSKVLKHLVRLGADVNTKNSIGNTPLHYAVESNNDVALLYLLSKHADYTIKNHLGITPLALAEQMKLDRIVNLIKTAVQY